MEKKRGGREKDIILVEKGKEREKSKREKVQ